MNRTTKLLLTLTAACLFSIGCTTPYVVPFIKGETLDVSSSFEGQIRDGLFEENQYEDEFLILSASISTYSLHINVLNKTNKSIFIDWNRAVFVDHANESHGVSHGGVKYIDFEKEQRISVIASSSFIEDVVIPIVNVKFAREIFEDHSSWHTRPLVPVGLDKYSWLANYKSIIDKSVRLIVPIVISEAEITYSISFQIVEAGEYDILRLENKSSSSGKIWGIGASTSEVLSIQGEPDYRERHIIHNNQEVWYYGESFIIFKNGSAIRYNNIQKNLFVN